MDYKVLFVCQGNVGRSQIAEGYYNHFTAGNNSISAGIDDVGHKYNYRPTDLIIEVMKDDGVDISKHVVKQLRQEMLSQVPIVCVLCDKSLCPSYLIDNDQVNIRFYEITDPYQAGREETIRIRDEIKVIIKSLIT